MNSGQQLALAQVERIAKQGNAVEIVDVIPPSEDIQSLRIELSVFCGDMDRVDSGLPLRDRERVVVWVGTGFPYSPPSVTVPHRRFAGFPHVNWSVSLCLYQAPQTEWSPRNGMFGLLSRLELWLREAALDQLDPTGGPLHPPVTYDESGPQIIPRCDAPVKDNEKWFGFGQLKLVSDHRVDIVGWCPEVVSDSGTVAAVILLDKPMPLEFPDKLGDLLGCLEERGVLIEDVLNVIRKTMLHNGKDAPLYVVLGTPMRGTRDGELCQHLTAWQSESFVGDVAELEGDVAATRASAQKLGATEIEESSNALHERVIGLLKSWAKRSKVTWCRIREDRPEVTTRRDTGRPTTAYQGLHVEIWGCGALGGYIAEWIVRAGADKVVLRDNGTVTPGILVRQPYSDDDIGRPKATVLAERLRTIRPDNCEIETCTSNIVRSPLGADCFGDTPNLVIDATASNAVLTKMEEVWRTHPDKRVPVASVAIDRNAERLLAVLSKAGHSGGPYDVVRKAKLIACRDARLRRHLDAFFPDPPPPPFQPEPGCSDATFVGSAADAASLSATGVNVIAQMLQDHDAANGGASFVSCCGSQGEPEHVTFSFASDMVVIDPQTDFETRIEPGAWRTMQARKAESDRIRGSDVETGGLLFGEMDEYLKVVWVTEVSGPPPDSEHSAEEFVCGIEGTAELNQEKCERSRKSVQYVGTWHTHPVSPAVPSVKDLAAMDRLLVHSPTPTEQLLLMIVGDARSRPQLSANVFERGEFETARRIGVMQRKHALFHAPDDPEGVTRNVGIALSGGGSRAIAFHLGCLRALHDRGVLSKTQVISTVSGGSVIGAMYAYNDDPFEEFESNVRQILQRGLVSAIARRTFLSPRLFQIAGTKLVAGTAASGAFIARSLLGMAERVIPKQSRAAGSLSRRIQPPLRRWVSRTNAFEQALKDLLFGEATLPSQRRAELDIVINACELRTGTAFRFGSRESKCWRYGKIAANDVDVATAVAASAAYPALLPAIDREFEFEDGSKRTSNRVILTDGGVYENLGVSCMTPGRDPGISSNVFSPRYIICCDAGPGQFSDTVLPYGWMTRMIRSFEATHRQVQHGLQKQLHLLRSHGELDGFVYSYLGQQDTRLPYAPPDLVTRNEVLHYPTDFSPMSQTDIELLSRRGEQLTHLLLEYYCPEL